MTRTVYNVVMYDYYTKETAVVCTVEDEDMAEDFADMCMDKDIMDGTAGRFLYSVEDVEEEEEEENDNERYEGYDMQYIMDMHYYMQQF